MLNEIYVDAVRNRETKISKLKDVGYTKILSEASSRWVHYEPSPRECESAGIDSSWNKRAFQGLYLYAVNAISVKDTNEILDVEWDSNISGSARGEFLEAKAMSMEASVAQKSADKVDVICIDGSPVTRSADTPMPTAHSVIFISKTSESRMQFASLGARAGDIYYFNHVGKSAGFSAPVEHPNSKTHVQEIYARLRDCTPIVKIEVVRSAISESEIKNILDRLCYHSIAGYPYCLMLAHKNCKISNEDIDRLASIYGLQHEPGARDALNE